MRSQLNAAHRFGTVAQFFLKKQGVVLAQWANKWRNTIELSLLESMVGAGRFELPTPCAQVGLRPILKMPYFQCILIQ